MKPADILTLDAYANCRDAIRERMIAHKRGRSVQFGPAMRLQFEDVLTVRYQIQEVLRIARADDPESVREEIERYAHLVPDGSCWCATLMIEEPAREARRRVLPLLHVAVPDLYLELGGIHRVMVRANEDLPRAERERPSAVHFLRFEFGEQARSLLFAGSPVVIGCDHEHYRWHAKVPPATLGRLMRDISRNTNPATRRRDDY